MFEDPRRIWAAATTAELATYPLDVLKTNVQNGAAMRSLRLGWRDLYRGVSVSVARQVCYTTLRMNVYRWAGAFLGGDGLANRVASGCFAGGVCQALITPFDTIKVQMQVQSPSPSPSPSRSHPGERPSLRAVLGRNTWRSLYKGAAPSIQRSMCVTVGELSSYNIIRDKIEAAFPGRHPLATTVPASLGAGLCATLLSNPADVVKTHMMHNPDAYSSSLQAYRTLYRRHGLRVFGRGLLQSWVRLGPWSMVYWMTYESLGLCVEPGAG